MFSLVFLLKGLPIAAPCSFVVPNLLEDDEQAKHNGEEGDAFHQSGGDNHRRADVATGFGLTGHAFHSALADFTDTDTGSDGSQTGSDSCSQVTPGDAGHCLQCNQ